MILNLWLVVPSLVAILFSTPTGAGGAGEVPGFAFYGSFVPAGGPAEQGAVANADDEEEEGNEPVSADSGDGLAEASGDERATGDRAPGEERAEVADDEAAGDEAAGDEAAGDDDERRVAQASGGSGELSADQVVAGVQAFYEETEHLTAVFRQVYTNQTFGRESVSDGRVWLKKPGKMRWDYQNRRTDEIHKSFISDGSKLWAIEHDNEQAFRKELDDTVLPVAVTFLTGDGRLSRDFDAELTDSRDYGDPDDYVLELTPREPTAHYDVLWLVIDPEDFRAKQSIVLEASGNTNHFRFYEPDTERPVQSEWFEVDEDALADYRIIEPEDG